jgi:hypothetical protein
MAVVLAKSADREALEKPRPMRVVEEMDPAMLVAQTAVGLEVAVAGSR